MTAHPEPRFHSRQPGSGQSLRCFEMARPDRVERLVLVNVPVGRIESVPPLAFRASAWASERLFAGYQSRFQMRAMLRHLCADDAAVNRWVAHWIDRGFSGLERWVASVPGAPSEAQAQRHCFGAQVTLADVCLVPQMFNARRFGVDVTPYPRLVAICGHLESLPAFVAARPDNQPDAEPAR